MERICLPSFSATGERARIFRKLIAGDLKGERTGSILEGPVGVVAMAFRTLGRMVGDFKRASRVLEGKVGVLKIASSCVLDSAVGVFNRTSSWILEDMVGDLKMGSSCALTSRVGDFKRASREREVFVGVFNRSRVLRRVESKDGSAEVDDDADLRSPA